MRYLMVLFAFLLVGQVQSQEVPIVEQLETILNLYETGLTKIEQGLTQLEAGQIQLDQAQMTLEKQLNVLEQSFLSYELKTQSKIKTLEDRSKFFAYAFFGVSLLVAIETIAFSIILNSPIYLNR